VALLPEDPVQPQGYIIPGMNAAKHPRSPEYTEAGIAGLTKWRITLFQLLSAVRWRGRAPLEDRLPKCILLVDDNPAIRMALRKFLEDHTDYEVCGEAADGLEAIEKAARLQPDLIVLDLSMPRMDGVEAARELKQRMPQVPLILFTMHAAALAQSDAAMAGFDAIISKTEGLQTLIDTVESLLEPV